MEFLICLIVGLVRYRAGRIHQQAHEPKTRSSGGNPAASEESDASHAFPLALTTVTDSTRGSRWSTRLVGGALVLLALCGCKNAERAKAEKAAEALERERLEDDRIAKVKAEFAERDREREARKLAMQGDAAGWESDGGGRVSVVGTVFPKAGECPTEVGGRVLLKIRDCGYEIGALTPHFVCDHYGYEKLNSILSLGKSQRCAQLAPIAALQPQ